MIAAILSAWTWIRTAWPWLRYVAGGIAVLIALGWLYSAVWNRGYEAADDKWKAAQRAAEAKAQADSWALVGNINALDVSLSADMAETQKARTLYRDRIRTVAVDVYRDRQCDLPDSVWNDLNAVRALTARPFTGTDSR